MVQLQFLIFPSLFLFVSATCGGQGGLVCCSGYIWDPQLKNCTKCPPGRFGLNCTGICLYPSYGELCKKQCTCVETECDKSRGCINTNDQTKTTIPSTVKFFTWKSELKSTKINTDQNEKYTNTQLNVPRNCFQCQDFHQPRRGYDALQIGVFSTTSLLTVVIAAYILSKIRRFFNTSKWSYDKKDTADGGIEEHYEELDEHTVKLNEQHLSVGRDDVKITFDKCQKRYYIEFKGLSEACSEGDAGIQCPLCSMKELPLVSSEVKPELTTENDYISPNHRSANEQTNIEFKTNTQSLKEENGKEKASLTEDSMYLTAIGEKK
ncbi:uncharacterized protein LOC134256621 [Saccostrea cucullata]|uniref:uncharacterized protein LOC134256621 n=1 Tax=Saccostrea cuccullata TaxID=36930 RepID=UPI002ED00531